MPPFLHHFPIPPPKKKKITWKPNPPPNKKKNRYQPKPSSGTPPQVAAFRWKFWWATPSTLDLPWPLLGEKWRVGFVAGLRPCRWWNIYTGTQLHLNPFFLGGWKFMGIRFMDFLLTFGYYKYPYSGFMSIDFNFNGVQLLYRCPSCN